jgi:hypothetical protein
MNMYASLPPYLGGKRRLAPLILAVVARFTPASDWRRVTFVDPMCGGSAVALTAKAMGLRVVASDVAERAAIVARALVANSSVRLVVDDVGMMLAGTRVNGVDADMGGTGEDLPRMFAYAGTRSKPLSDLLRLMLIRAMLRMFPMSLPSATDRTKAKAGDFDSISPARVANYHRADRHLGYEALVANAEDINRGVIGGSGVAMAGDARDVLAAVNADIAYLDPPYPGTTGYGSSYRLLDEMLGDTSPTDLAPPTLYELLDASTDIPLVLISMGGPRVSLDQLVRTVSAHRRVVDAIEVPHTHLHSLRKGARGKEYLLVAER